MELLTIKHQDFTMSIECSKFDAIWQKAASNVGVENLTSSYSWSEGVLSVVRMDEEGHKIALYNPQNEMLPFHKTKCSETQNEASSL